MRHFFLTQDFKRIYSYPFYPQPFTQNVKTLYIKKATTVWKYPSLDNIAKIRDIFCYYQRELAKNELRTMTILNYGIEYFPIRILVRTLYICSFFILKRQYCRDKFNHRTKRVSRLPKRWCRERKTSRKTSRELKWKVRKLE